MGFSYHGEHAAKLKEVSFSLNFGVPVQTPNHGLKKDFSQYLSDKVSTKVNFMYSIYFIYL